MLTLNEQDYEVLDKIHQFLYLGDWESAAQKASKLLEDFLYRIYNSLATSMPPEEFENCLKRGREILEAQGKKFSPTNMTFGTLSILFRESDLFKVYGKKNNCDLTILRSMDWKKLVDLRNLVSHGGKDKIKPADAYFIVDSLHLFLRTASDWSPRKPKEWLSKYLTSRLRYIIPIVVILLVFVPFTLYLTSHPTVSKSNAMLAGHGQEIAELLEKRGAYDLALWALDGDPTVFGRDGIRYRLLKLQAQKIKNYDPVQAYLLYNEALGVSIRGDQDAIVQIQKDLLDKMRTYDQILVKIKMIPSQILLIIVAILIGGILMIRILTRRKVM
jgi:hypothetical protein